MEKLTITLLPNEHWWGGTVENGQNMPYNEYSDCKIDQIEQYSVNQVDPLLLSDQGRLLYAPNGLRYTFAHGVLTVEGDDLCMKETGGSLRDAFRLFKTEICPDEGTMPDFDLIRHPQYNTWIELMHDQREDKILAYAEDIIQNGMPTGVIMIDATWQEDYGVWDFHPGRFKDPKGMIDRLHALGFKVMLWVAPFVSPDSLTYMELSAHGLLLKEANGADAVRRWWDGYSAVLDLTNEKTVDWFKAQLDRLIKDYGIDGFKFDAGDAMFYRRDDRTAMPTNPNDQCRRYGAFGTQYPLNEYRACYGLTDKPLVQRLADKEHSWGSNGMAALIPNSLAQSLTGYRFICPDMIGGGEYRSFLTDDVLDEELFVRYAQCSALLPMMQFSADPFRVLSAQNAALCRQAAWLHEKNGDRIVALIRRCMANCDPVIAPPCYYDPKAPADEKNVFMLSDEFVVAPVVNKGDRSRELYLPEGKWRAWNGEHFTGGQRICVKAELPDLPYFERVFD